MRILYIAASLAAVTFLGTIGYSLIEGWSLAESFYMTMITITTVGYGEVHNLSTMGRMFTVTLLLMGVGTVFYATASVAEAMIEGRIRQIFGRRKLVKELERLEDHHIICGYGRIGFTIAREYARESLPCVVIENDESIATRLDAEGRLVIFGDATLDETLIRANVKKAQSLVCTLATDADNVFVTLTARALNPRLFILSRAARESSISKMEAAGANRVVSPYIMGGIRMAQSVLRPKLASFLDEVTSHAKTDLDFEEVNVPPESNLAGMALRESRISQDTGVYLLSIRQHDGRMRFNPGPDFQIQAGDRLYALGTPEQVRALRARVLAGQGRP